VPEAFVFAVVLLVLAGLGWAADHTPASDGEEATQVKNRRLVHDRRTHGSQQPPAPKPSK
jgi:hypothetical protein